MSAEEEWIMISNNKDQHAPVAIGVADLKSPMPKTYIKGNKFTFTTCKIYVKGA